MAGVVSKLPSEQLAWYYEEYGELDVLKLGMVPVPDLADDQVLVKVMAAALNPIDYKRRLGYIKANDSQFPTVPGYDMAGIVVKVGAKVTTFQIGDEVYGDINKHALDHPHQWGTLAAYVAAEEEVIAKKPKNLSFMEAASLPLALLTAYQAFVEGGFKGGNSVLVIGGAGGVGSLAIQVAKAVFKASYVAAVASKPKEPLLTSLGANKVIDYKTTDYTTLSDSYDFVFDCVGEGEKAHKVLKEGGKTVAIWGPPGQYMVLVSEGRRLEALKPYIEDGSIKPVLYEKSPFAFKDVKGAFAALETGHVTGKVVVASMPEG